MTSEKMRNIKKRYWAMILYPESAPSNWRDILQEKGVVCAVSPLHDKDTNPTGEPKKVHYHIILCYDGPTTYKSVLSLTEELNQPIPQPLEQLRGYYRYLIHKDNPEKYQYDECLITTINGFDVSNYLDLTNNQVIAILKQLTAFIEDNTITEYADLIKILRENDFYSQFLEIAINKTFFLNTFITSYRNKLKESIK